VKDFLENIDEKYITFGLIQIVEFLLKSNISEKNIEENLINLILDLLIKDLNYQIIVKF